MEDHEDDSETFALLQTLDEIEPKNLESSSYTRYLRRIVNVVSTSLLKDSTNLLIIIQTIKSCKVACFKRDILIEVLDQVIFSDDDTLSYIIHDNLRTRGTNHDRRWKDMSNTLATLPDLIANCDSLKKFTRFKNDVFYTHLLREIYSVLERMFQKGEMELIGINQICFFVQLIGRIAISGFSALVWEMFTSKAMNESREKLRNMIANMITFPLQNDNQISLQFEMYIEPLYFPIFSSLKPSKSSGKLIKLILGDQISRHDSFEYIICNKSILQTNYTLKRHRQYTILFNIFSYLADLNNSEDSLSTIGEEKNKDISLENNLERSNLIIKTLLEVTRSWSNSTKILFRPYEQNRYISSALLIGFRLAFEKNKQDLTKSANKIHSQIVQGFPIYLNRASFQHRNLSMCLGEILLPRLSELTDNISSSLNFEVEWDDDTKALRELFYSEIEKLYDDDDDDADVDNNVMTVSRDIETSQVKSDCDIDEDEEIVDVPIYLRDCITGLAENTSPNYVKLCLIKAGELTDQLLSRENEADKNSLDTRANVFKLNDTDKSESSFSNDAIRDIAVELTQTLLYLDNQYNIDGFDRYRMKALCSICFAAPDLVVKYLLDEFNGTNRNTRHQLDILQVLVMSAQYISGNLKVANEHQNSKHVGGSNKFVKYVSLYFYGIVHRLKADLTNNILPTTIISATKLRLNTEETIIKRVIAGSNLKISTLFPATRQTRPTSSASKQRLDEKQKDYNLDDSYLLSRIFYSLSQIIECVHQQPITCRLTDDLLDVLAAYRHLADSGVRKAIVSCLIVIKECTPTVHFREFLYDKTVCLFADWLKDEIDLVNISNK